jgi:hypothetical protein
MRSEDLLDFKYESLLKLADFVGSSLSPQEICCLSRKENKDIGKYLSTQDVDKPRVFTEEDFDAIRGRFHAFDSANFGAGSGIHKWSGAGSWEDMRAKMVAQHQNDNNFRRRLLQSTGENPENGGLNKMVVSKVRPGDNLKPSDVNFSDLNHFYQRRGKMTRDVSKKPPDAIRGRYGKWKQKLEGNPELGYRLHNEGRVALNTFGYEPLRTFMDLPRDSASPICDDSVICSDYEGGP